MIVEVEPHGQEFARALYWRLQAYSTKRVDRPRPSTRATSRFHGLLTCGQKGHHLGWQARTDLRQIDDLVVKNLADTGFSTVSESGYFHNCLVVAMKCQDCSCATSQPVVCGRSRNTIETGGVINTARIRWPDHSPL
ncbi:hypothetical protein D3C84_993270 [compost metagenome]